MTLPFSQAWPKKMGELAGQPNYFVDKIWASFNPSCKDITTYNESCKQLLGVDLFQYQDFLIHQKLHSIREDKADRWKAGNEIHFVINNRTKNRFQFAPVIKCVSVQSIEITKSKLLEYGYAAKMPLIYIDDVLLESDDLEKLAINDGFPTLKAFFDFFNKDFKGKIIHWTDFKY